MVQVNLVPFNESYVKVHCDEGIFRELHDYFTIKIDNGHHFRMKKWNGKLKLLDARNRQIYRGLIPYIKDYCQSKDISINTNNLDIENEISLFEVQKFVESLNIHIDGKPAQLHDHQLKYITKALRCKRLSLLSPTSSGKSLIVYVIVRSILKYTNKKILIIVPRTNLIRQLFGDFADYSSNNGWSTLSNCHQIFSGMEKHSDKRIYISTWQSLYKMPVQFFEQFGCVMGDEMHEYAADSAKYIINSCINAKYRFGLTGTLKDTKCHIMVLQGLFGQIYRATTTRELMDKKILSDLQIKCILLNHNLISEKMKYPDEIEYLINDEKRNKFIVNLAMSLQENTCIFFRYVEKHGEILKKLLEEANKDGKKKIHFISGKIHTDIREEIRRITDSEKDNVIIVASFQTFSTGANIKNLHHIIYAAPTKDKIKIFQSIGRELRLHPSKECAYLYDIADDVNGLNYTLDHFKSRLEMYKSEKFGYKIYPIELKEYNV